MLNIFNNPIKTLSLSIIKNDTMTLIKNIIKNLKTEKAQEFDIFNKDLQMEWTLRFEFIEGEICMMVNDSTLTATWFDTLSELKKYLNSSFLSEKGYKLM